MQNLWFKNNTDNKKNNQKSATKFLLINLSISSYFIYNTYISYRFLTSELKIAPITNRELWKRLLMLSTTAGDSKCQKMTKVDIFFGEREEGSSRG